MIRISTGSWAVHVLGVRGWGDPFKLDSPPEPGAGRCRGLQLRHRTHLPSSPVGDNPGAFHIAFPVLLRAPGHEARSPPDPQVEGVVRLLLSLPLSLSAKGIAIVWGSILPHCDGQATVAGTCTGQLGSFSQPLPPPCRASLPRTPWESPGKRSPMC